MYNCGFGDCFLIYDKTDTNNSCILLDGGSIKNVSNNQKKQIILDIERELKRSKTNYGIITHFHSDHYNYVKKLPPKIFDEYFFPNLYFCKDIVKLNLYTYLGCNINDEIRHFALNMLTFCNLLPKLKDNGKINLLMYNANFLNTYEVLWPDMKLNSPKIEVFLKELEIEYFIGVDTNIIDKIASRYVNVCSTGSVGKRQLRQLITFTRTELENIKRINFSEHEKEKIKSFQNECSLVFHELEGNTKWLFLGDIDTKNFENTIIQRIEKKYDYVKVSHHGTASHFTKKLPESSFYMISNLFRKNFSIDAQYHLFYLPHSMICTNNSGCDFYNNYCKKKFNPLCHNCYKVAQNYICGFRSDIYKEFF